MSAELTEQPETYKVGRHHQKKIIDQHIQGSKDTTTSPKPEVDIERQDSEEKGFDLADALLGPREDKNSGFKKYMNKGDMSSVVTFIIFIVGIIVQSTTNQNNKSVKTFSDIVLSVGLFGFSGGITNWLAVKMLFDKVGCYPYYLYGSGVIPRQFKEIREALKNMIMKMFFEKEFLESYLNDRAKAILDKVDLGDKLKSAMAEPEFDKLLEDKLTELSSKPEGMLVMTLAPMFGGIGGMVPVIKPFLGAFGEEMFKVMIEKLSVHDLVSIDSIIEEIELLLNEKLKLVTPEMVKQLLEEVIRVHLGWLVVWGNIFGGVIGLISALAGYGV